MSHGHSVDLENVDAETAGSIAQAMQALSTPSRVLILSRLAAGGCAVSELAQEIGMSQPAVSQQLRVLRYLGMVVGAREGRRVVYELHDDHVRSLLEEAVSHIEHIRLGVGVQSEHAGSESVVA